MQSLQIPHFNLTEQQQKELVDHIIETERNLENYYAPYDTRVKRARAAKNVQNFEKDLLPILVTGKDKVENRPNVCFPWVKAVGNQLTSEIYKSMFTPDFLTFVPADPKDYDIVEDLTDAFNTVRERTRTDEVEEIIINNLVYDATVPVVITNTGRINAVHEVIPTYMLELTDELRMLLNQASRIDGYNNLDMFMDNAVRGAVSMMLPVDVGSKLYFKEEDVQMDNETFKGVSIVSETGLIIKRFTDEPESGIKAIEQAFSFLSSMGIDTRAIKTIQQEVKTTEEWVEGLPRPEIKDILRTRIVPPDEDNNPDTYKFICSGWAKTQEIYDNPDFINRDKLMKENGELIGDTSISYKQTDEVKTNVRMQSYTASEKIVGVKTAYFNHYKFKQEGAIKELRNFIVTIVCEKHLVECRPNVYYEDTPSGKITKSPLILMTFDRDANENIGTSPIFDIIDLAKTANILVNWSLDSLARNGNQWVYMTDVVDIQTANGGTATHVKVNADEARAHGIKSVNDAYSCIGGNPNEALNAMQTASFIEDRINNVSKASQPPMQKYTQQTATQASLMFQQLNTMTEKITKHTARGHEEMYSRQLDDLIKRGIKIENIPYYDNQSKQTYFKNFDFGELRGKKFVPKITSVTPTLNKQIQVNMIEKLIGMVMPNIDPMTRAAIVQSRVNLSELIQEWMKKADLDNPNILKGDKEAEQEFMKLSIKEQLFNAIQSGQFQLQPAPVQPGTTGSQQLQQKAA